MLFSLCRCGYRTLVKRNTSKLLFVMNINKAIFTIHTYASWLPPKLAHTSTGHDLSLVLGVRRQMD